MSQAVTGPAYSGLPDCTVAIYPFEGGQYTLTSANGTLLSAEVTNTVAASGGSFMLNLAPGGPNGLNAQPGWIDVLTQMSLVVIGMARGGQSRIVMIGLVVQVGEQQVRSPRGVTRGIGVSGVDFSRLFTTFNFYNLFALTGLGTGGLGPQGILGDLGQGNVSDTPASIAQQFYTRTMAGPNGLLSQTSFPTATSRVLFGNLMATWFEQYPFNLAIPAAATFIGADGSWADKFATLLPSPFYERFWITAPTQYYQNATQAQTSFALPGYGDTSPTFVCRVNPLPYTPLVSSNGSTATFTYDQTRWLTLEHYTLPSGPFQSQMAYSDAEVHNLYIMNPTFLMTLFGNQNSNTSPFSLNYAAWIDNNSIHRYGYRPYTSEVIWWADPDGLGAQQNNVSYSDFENFVADLSLRVTSYFEPTPLMARASVSTLLHPEWMPGNRFTFAPYKNNQSWDFYISAVTHSYQFGQSAGTTLALSRGLPSTVYQNEDLMIAIHTGNAQRVNGVISKGTFGVKGATLSPFNLQTATTLSADNSAKFVTPQTY